MIRRSLATLILGPSLLIASLAWSGFVALQTVLDPDRSREVAEELLDNDEVQAQLTANLAGAIGAGLPEAVPVSDEQIDAAATAVLADPAVEALLLDALGSTHAAFLGEGQAPETLSLAPVTEAAQAALAAVPGAEAVVPELPTLEFDLPTDRIPDASPLRTFTQQAVPVLAVLAALGVLLALFTTTDRASVLWRAGVWAVGAAAFSLIVGVGLPWLIRRLAPDGAEVFAALLSALLGSVVMPAIVLAVGGVVLMVVAVAAGGSGGRGRPGTRTEARGMPAPGPVVAGSAPGSAAWPGPYPAGPHPSSGYQPQPGVPYQPPPQQPGVPYQPPPQQPGVPYQPPPQQPGVPYQQPGVSYQPPPQQPGVSYPPPYPPQSYPPQPAPPPQAHAPDPTVFAPPPGAPPPAGPSATAPLPPRWIDGHGWVMHPNDSGPPPPGSTWVAGVGYVLGEQPPPPRPTP